jgi:hypothetical protein
VAYLVSTITSQRVRQTGLLLPSDTGNLNSLIPLVERCCRPTPQTPCPFRGDPVGATAKQVTRGILTIVRTGSVIGSSGESEASSNISGQ